MAGIQGLFPRLWIVYESLLVEPDRIILFKAPHESLPSGSCAA